MTQLLDPQPAVFCSAPRPVSPPVRSDPHFAQVSIRYRSRFAVRSRLLTSQEVCVVDLHPLLATFTYKHTRWLIQIGLLVGLVGSLGVAAGGMGSRARTQAFAIGGLLLALGLGLVIIAVHFGVSPFRHR